MSHADGLKSGGLKADIFGGVSAAIVALPLALGFGVAAFAPLGTDFAAAGALAGLIGAAFTGVFASLFGGTPAQITGPTGPMTVVITATVARFVGFEGQDGPIDTAMVLTLTFATVLLGGVFQILLGALRAGTAIKFIPYPVIAGFMNGIALIIFIGQIEPVLGITEGRFWQNFHIVPQVLATAGVTILSIYVSKRLMPKLPASLVGLVVGTCAYFLIAKLTAPELMVFAANHYIVGDIPTGVPLPKNVGAFVSLLANLDAHLLTTLVTGALVLGMLGAIDSLLTSLVADVATKTRHDSNRELIGQGIGNVIASLFGGISGAGATVRTLVNVDAGGRGRASGVTHGVVLLAILMIVGSLAGWIPMSVLGGILIVTAIGMVDTRSLKLVRKRTAWLDLAVVLLVTVVTVVVDLMVAVGVGFLITLLLFLREVSSVSVVRHKYRCGTHRSKHLRGHNDEAFLKQHGDGILVFELKGSLFFGSTSRFAADIEMELDRTRYLILDLEHVDTIDITGAELIKRIADNAADAGVELLVSHINPSHRRDREPLERYLRELHVIDAIMEQDIFASVDRAIEGAEDRILATAGPSYASAEVCGLVRGSDLFEHLSDDQWRAVSEVLERSEHAPGDVIFEVGDASGWVAIVEQGRVSQFPGDHAHRGTRLATLGPGLSFGRKSLILETTRAATAVADTDVVLQRLTREALEGLIAKDPEAGVALFRGMSHALLERLRTTTHELVQERVET